jgi:hypothetical protein
MHQCIFLPAEQLSRNAIMVISAESCLHRVGSGALGMNIDCSHSLGSGCPGVELHKQEGKNQCSIEGQRKLCPSPLLFMVSPSHQHSKKFKPLIKKTALANYFILPQEQRSS